ncbi:MAG: potassium-transporting ATPase subunit KdpA [Candidatus Eremiobacteraeota bacterium]|nr:potassium-transporting ATPase subunit KdpA [Candidatus Eremiobacteraeota bacterium]
MTLIGWLQSALFFALVCAAVVPVGAFMYRVYEGERTWLAPVLGPLERLVYRLCRIDPSREMSWVTYAFALMAFHVIGFIWLYGLLVTQQWLPLNPQHFANLAPDLAFNTAVSFLTNTNWQFYSGENALSYLVQMAGLAWHNFVSAAAGMCVAIALIRGIVRTDKSTLGNFWADLTRGTLYIFLPIAFVGALFLLWQGVPQNFSAYTDTVSMEGAKISIPQGPMASQEVIKELGTNGGGFVNANSAATFENPTPFSNLAELWLILVIGAALTYTFGKYARDQRQGWALFAAMTIMFAGSLATCYYFEAQPNPLMAAHGVTINFEGLETRFGVAASTLWAVVTTITSCGAVNAMHDSFNPIAGLVPMANIQTGEVIFGGVGAGMYGMLLFVVLTVFIAGLMVGRTPEYLGKKIEGTQVKLAMLGALVFAVFPLIPAAIAVVLPAGLNAMNNSGPHGFSEVLYMTTSWTGNNGSAFAGIGSNLFTNLLGGVTMFGGRFAEMIPVLALAGSLAGKRAVPFSSGTFKTTTALFVALLIGVVVLVGLLTFLPADSLGPIVEHLLMQNGKTF